MINKVNNQKIYFGNAASKAAGITTDVVAKTADEAVKELSTLKKYIVPNGEKQKPHLDQFTFLTNVISSACYILGGASLIYDFGWKKFNKKHPETQQQNNVQTSRLLNNPYSSEVFASFIKNKKVSFGSGGGARTIKPETNVAKTGIKLARVAAVVAGVAGVLNGITLGIPLLAIGEGVTIGAAPVIETPMGIGLFGIGLAAINLSRVLEGDLRFIIDRAKFSSMSTVNKIKYVATNVKDTSKELLNSMSTIAKNAGNLFTSNKKRATEFFKESMFSKKPSSFILQEFMTKDAKLFVKKATLANPYLMHFATLLLGGASTLLIASNAFKWNLGEKIGLRGYNVGNAFDNVALSKWGMESIEQAKVSKDALGKASGRCFALAGAGLLLSQPGIDRDWGRGLNWAAVGLIMGGFGFMRKRFIMDFINNRKVKEELSSVMRQWKFDLKDIFDIKALRQSIDVIDATGKKVSKERFEAIKDMDQIADKTDKKTIEFIEQMKQFYLKLYNKEGKFNDNTKDVEGFINECFGQNNSKAIKQFSDPSNMQKALEFLNTQSTKTFGEKPVIA